MLPSSTHQVNVTIDTNELAACKYSIVPDQSYDQMLEVFSSTDSLYHVANISGLMPGSEYVYNINCKDFSENTALSNTVVSFSIAPEAAPPDDNLPPVLPEPKVVINEIAWMGGVISPSDEWIELYNPSNTLVDLSGWRLTWNGNNIVLSKSIEAHGFYLLEKTNDDTVPQVPADQIYSGSYSLRNGGEDVYFYDNSGNIVDQIDCHAGWFAGNNTTTKQTMQRIDWLVSGNVSDNWQTSQFAGGSPRS
jgi:hypothetical protein